MTATTAEVGTGSRESHGRPLYACRCSLSCPPGALLLALYHSTLSLLGATSRPLLPWPRKSKPVCWLSPITSDCRRRCVTLQRSDEESDQRKDAVNAVLTAFSTLAAERERKKKMAHTYTHNGTGRALGDSTNHLLTDNLTMLLPRYRVRVTITVGVTSKSANHPASRLGSCEPEKCRHESTQ